MRMFDRIEFVISEALSALSRNRLMTLAAVTTVAVSLFLFGGLGYAYFRVNNFAQSVPGKFQMQVYLKDSTSRQDVSKVASDLRAVPGVASATFIPKEGAWLRWKHEHPTALSQGVENPLPDGFKVILSDLKQSDAVVTSLKAMPAVEEVRYMREEQNFVETLLTIFRWIGLVVGGVLFLTAGVLIYNAIRLTVLSRRIEIRIMQLVGASRLTVYIPFLIEGMLQGIMGAALATGLVIGGYAAVSAGLEHLTVAYTPAVFPYLPVLGMLAAAGAIYGVFCSMLAIRAPLKYR